MTRELEEFEGRPGASQPFYLRFSRAPVVRTESFAAGEVNVDLDGDGQVIGIELLSTEPDELDILILLMRAHDLSISNLFAGNVRHTS